MNHIEDINKIESEAPKGNCYGYVAYRLGYNEPQSIFGFSDYDKYIEVYSIEEADFLEIHNTRTGGTSDHMVFIDRTQSGIILSERPNFGQEIRTTDLDKLEVTYPKSIYKYVYFKRRN